MKTHLFMRRLTLTLLALFTTTMAWADGLELLNGYTLTEQSENTYLITSVDDWNALADYVKEGNDCFGLTFLMTNNIGTEEEPVVKTLGFQTQKDDESSRMRFCGTFDGCNNTLTVRLTSAEINPNYCAPFAFVQYSTIKNLHVAGSITATGQFAAGLIGSTSTVNNNGTCTVENCHVSIDLIGNYRTANNRFPNHGGFIGITECNTTITNCWFDGSFTGVDFQHSGGFIGLNKKETTFNNCLFNPYKIEVENNNYRNAHEFANSVHGTCDYEDTYYTMAFGSDINSFPQGKIVYDREIPGCTPTEITAIDGNKYILNTISIEVSGYGDTNGGWVFIASPVKGVIEPSYVDNLLGEQIGPHLYNFDLYRFNQNSKNGKVWENYHAHTNDFVLRNNCGYLYASQDGTTLTFTGEFNEGSSKVMELSYVSGKQFSGWNLIGNPFTVPAYVNRSYYKVNADGTDIELVDIASNKEAIPACTGIMVKASNNKETITFSTTKEGNNAENRGTLSIALTKANTRGNAMLDRAIVSFNEGSDLGKFYFRENDANIFIPQGNEDYAIVSVGKDAMHCVSTEIPVHFKAAVDGEYTLTVNPESVDMNYLHLIDNIAGVEIDLLAEPSYTFSAKNDDYASRFRLVFSAQGNGDQANVHDEFAFISNGNLIVNGEGTFQLYDLTGRMVVSEDAMHCVSTAGMTPGVYIVRLINGNEVNNQKIIIK